MVDFQSSFILSDNTSMYSVNTTKPQTDYCYQWYIIGLTTKMAGGRGNYLGESDDWNLSFIYQIFKIFLLPLKNFIKLTNKRKNCTEWYTY